MTAHKFEETRTAVSLSHPKDEGSSSKEISPRNFLNIYKVDLPFILIGGLFSVLMGCANPVSAVIVSRLLQVSC